MLKINIYVILEVKASTINLIKIGQSDSALNYFTKKGRPNNIEIR